MNEKTSYNLVELAFKRKELDKLFLGIEPYTYIPKFSCASGNIDLSTVIPSGIFPFIKQHNSPDNIAYLNEVLNHLCDRYDGLDATATYVLCSTTYKFTHGNYPIKINIDQLAEKIKKTINHYRLRLKADFTDYGFGCNEGRYGDLKRLSLIVQKDGGPNFFPEDNQQDEGIKP